MKINLPVSVKPSVSPDDLYALIEDLPRQLAICAHLGCEGSHGLKSPPPTHWRGKTGERPLATPLSESLSADEIEDMIAARLDPYAVGFGFDGKHDEAILEASATKVCLLPGVWGTRSGMCSKRHPPTRIPSCLDWPVAGRPYCSVSLSD